MRFKRIFDHIKGALFSVPFFNKAKDTFLRIDSLSAAHTAVERSNKNRGIFDGSEKTDADLKKWWFAFQRAAAAQGVPLRVVWGHRTWDEQEKLYSLGRSKAKGGQSPHNFGLALDIIHSTRGWDGMTPAAWLLLGTLGKEVARQQGLKLTWGGDWGADWSVGKAGWDCAHWQYADWRVRTAKT